MSAALFCPAARIAWRRYHSKRLRDRTVPKFKRTRSGNYLYFNNPTSLVTNEEVIRREWRIQRVNNTLPYQLNYHAWESWKTVAKREKNKSSRPGAAHTRLLYSRENLIPSNLDETHLARIKCVCVFLFLFFASPAEMRVDRGSRGRNL